MQVFPISWDYPFKFTTVPQQVDDLLKDFFVEGLVDDVAVADQWDVPVPKEINPMKTTRGLKKRSQK